MDYLTHLAILITIYAPLALSLNLVVGFAGLPSIAHAAFYGVGAYAVGVLTLTYGIGFFPSVLVGVLISLLLALIFGVVLSRFGGDYYVLASLGLSVIITSIFLNWRSVTRGSIGIPGIDRPELFGTELDTNTLFLAFALIVLGLVYVLCAYVVRTPFGRALKAIREDETVLRMFGYETYYFKLTAFLIAAGVASVSGAMYASYVSFIDPSSFSLNESILILAMVILGGLANMRGSLAGALLLILLPEALRFVGLPSDVAAQLRQIIYGLLLLLIMHVRPHGLFGEYRM